jgi:hypothetical protein
VAAQSNVCMVLDCSKTGISLSCVLHVPPIQFLWFDHLGMHLVNSTGYEAPHYASFSILMLLPLSGSPLSPLPSLNICSSPKGNFLCWGHENCTCRIQLIRIRSGCHAVRETVYMCPLLVPTII